MATIIMITHAVVRRRCSCCCRRLVCRCSLVVDVDAACDVVVSADVIGVVALVDVASVCVLLMLSVLPSRLTLLLDRKGG